ncbi:gamma-glutamyltranspeptidase [Aeropyrum pernix]|uniref:Gamma-glutamyltranspeptidase n=1 Tax=Aeropyrum pernix TaxID=56636 RepID=A0A401HAW8_AERPX|nr:gamma-glutamyltransferase family protein [Aeropyrum pernix]GBF09605.1 gamma-glutamyltranspeptidase [Aeropyrum pernix]
MAKASAESLGGAVASEESIASYIGAGILSSGGNAVDAAVATSLALTVLIPHLGGVGGDFFMLYRSPEGRVFFVNGSGFAPRRLTREEVLGRGLKEIPESGPLSPTTPGYLAGLYHSWRSFGAMEWASLVKPARLLASRGFPLPPSTARSLKLRRECLEADPGSREAVLKALPREEGSPARLPGLAALLSGVEEDPLYLYRGEPAEALEEYLASIGGVMGAEDLAGTRGFTAEPLYSEYRGWKVWEMPPNTQGITTLHLLMLLEEEEPPEPFSTERVDILTGLARMAYSIRDRYVGDPRYMPIDPHELARKETLLKLLGQEESNGSKAAGDTTFFAVADREGGIVAGIQSLFYPWGSCVTEPRFQVTLNNRARGFTLKEGLPSTLRPGAFPLHTLSSVIMEQRERVIALGASGGHLRPQQHALFVTNIVDYGMNVLDAINAPRAVWDPGRGEILCEEGFGCRPSWRKVERIGVANAVEVVGSVKRGYTDIRGDGLPAVAP